jgi:hypothetical protein
MAISFTTPFKHIGIIIAAALLIPMLASAANKSTLGSGTGLDASLWTTVGGVGAISCDGTAAVVGSGTNFTAELFYFTGYAPASSILYIDGNPIGIVLSIEDDTHLTLAAAATGGAFTTKAFTHQSVPMPGDNVTIVSPHAITLLGVSGLTINDLTIESGAQLESDCYLFNITGNLVINGTFTQDPGLRLIMDGGASTIGGSPSPVVIRSLRVKTTVTPAVTSLNAPLVVSDKLDIENGSIDLNGQTLTVGTAVGSAGELLLQGAYHIVNGPGTMTRWIDPKTINLGDAAGAFPLAAANAQRDVFLGGIVTSGGSVSVTSSETPEATPFVPFTETLSFENRSNVNWDVSCSPSFNANSISLLLEASGLPGVIALSDLTMCGAGGAAGGTFSATTGSLTDPRVNRTFTDQTTLAGRYYIASTSGSPLPVELSSFNAEVHGRTIMLQWTTATENNNFGFEIQRRAIAPVPGATTAGWLKLGFVEGHGTTNVKHAYSYADNNLVGSYAYRLKQTDRDGRVAYTNVIEAAALPTESDYSLSQNYPNPFNPATNIQFMLHTTQRATVKVYSAIGQEVRTLFDGVAEGNSMQTVVFDASALASGIYFYRIHSAEKTEVRKMQLLR